MAEFEEKDSQWLGNTIKNKRWNLQIEDRVMLEIYKQEQLKRSIRNDRKRSVIFFIAAAITGYCILLFPDKLSGAFGNISEYSLIIQAGVILSLLLAFDQFRINVRYFSGKNLKAK